MEKKKIIEEIKKEIIEAPTDELAHRLNISYEAAKELQTTCKKEYFEEIHFGQKAKCPKLYRHGNKMVTIPE